MEELQSETEAQDNALRSVESLSFWLLPAGGLIILMMICIVFYSGIVLYACSLALEALLSAWSSNLRMLRMMLSLLSFVTGP